MLERFCLLWKSCGILGEGHFKVIDLDNLIKSVCDALNEEDSNIYQIHAEKWNSYEGMIEINENVEKNIQIIK